MFASTAAVAWGWKNACLATSRRLLGRGPLPAAGAAGADAETWGRCCGAARWTWRCLQTDPATVLQQDRGFCAAKVCRRSHGCEARLL